VRPRTQELRVHGVGGSHGPRMLGFESGNDVVLVGEGAGGTSVLARRNDPTVESYDWGDLTSGTGSKPFWVFLLPFTLINLAGWMHPPAGGASPWLVRRIRELVHLLSGLLTAMYVFTFGIILVELSGYQWAARVAASDAGVAPATDVLFEQKIGVVLGLVALLGVVAALVYTAGTSQQEFEGQPLSSLQDMDRPKGVPWQPDERLSSQGFFFHPEAARRRFRAHLIIAVVCWLAVCALAVYRAFINNGDPVRDQLKLHELLGGSSGLAYVSVGLLWLTSLGAKRKPSERWTRSGPAIAATLGFGLVNAVVSGTILLLIKQLNKWPSRPENAPVLRGGPEVNLVDVWGGLVIGFGVAAAVLGVIIVFFPRADADDVAPLRSSGPGCQVDGLPRAMRKSVVRARYLAQLARHGGLIVFVIALSIYLVGVVSVTFRVDWAWFPDLPPPSNTGAPLYQVGAYVLPVLALLLVQLVRKGRQGARTFASTLWDVFTFWPRRFSPLAVRPYSERAVPELQGRILYHTKDKHEPCPLVLSAHSQGSVLAFAALSPLSAEQLQRVALVTYGSPISTIYAMFFPAYFGPEEVSALRDKLPAPGGLTGWRNFYRRTDPIGGPVFADTTTPENDTEVGDPFAGPAEELGDACPPLERDGTPWLRVSGHSYYMQEPALRNWLRDVRLALDP
jgi:RsiW-degrading membrane proteinase PrsW (M82 family)